MFRAAKIIKANIMVMQKDLLPVIRFLGESGKIQLIEPPQKDQTVFKSERAAASLVAERLGDLSRQLNFPLAGSPQPNDPVEPSPADLDRIRLIESATGPIELEQQALQSALSDKRNALSELEAFRALHFDFRQLNEVSFLHFQYGTIPQRQLDPLIAEAGSRIIIHPVQAAEVPGNRTAILAITTRKGRFAMDTLLEQYPFTPLILPPDVEGIPAELAAALEAEIAGIENRLQEVDNRFLQLKQEHGTAILEIHRINSLRRTLLEAATLFQHTGYTSSVNCWIALEDLEPLQERLNSITADKVVIEVDDPKKWSLKERREQRVPVILKNNRLLRPFESLISNFGYPEYGEIEPTPVVALGFILMFGIMFGDVGQGGILLLTGLLLSIQKKLKTPLRLAGRLVASAGLSAIFFGFVYGSVFSNPHLIHPLWKEPLADPSNIMTLFAATVIFGIFWINTGLLLNLINRFRFREWKEALLEKTGLTGILFYWAALFTVLSKAVLHIPVSFDLLLPAMIAPLAIIFFKEPLYNLCTGKKPFEHGFLTFLMEGIVELIDTLSYFLGNTVSFVRVGAFALAHSGLSMAVMELYKLVGGGVAGILVLLLGNALIIVLEGMVVTIQTLRLEYYEFFSKFYSGSGRPFVPFTLGEAGIPATRPAK